MAVSTDSGMSCLTILLLVWGLTSAVVAEINSDNRSLGESLLTDRSIELQYQRFKLEK